MAAERSEYQNITIEDVDQSIYDWFDKIVDAHVETPTEESSKVPILFASGERWATARDSKGVRDDNGLLILPIISLRRTGLDRTRDKLALGTEQRRFTISKRVDKKTNIVKNAISSRAVASRSSAGKVVHEVTTIPFPDWFVTSYEVIIQAQYTTQMNKMIEKIFDSFDIQNQFVAPLSLSKFKQDPSDTEWEEKKKLEGYYFVGMVDTNLADTGNFEEFTDTERIVKYSMNITVPTYLQLDPDGTKPSIQTELTSFEVSFSDENVCFVDDESYLDDIFSFKKPN